MGMPLRYNYRNLLRRKTRTTLTLLGVYRDQLLLRAAQFRGLIRSVT